MARGKVVLKTSPSGFSVTIDGTTRAYATPYTVSLPAGPHSFLMQRAGYLDWSFSYTVRDGVQKTFSHTGVPTAAPPPEPPPPPPPPPERTWIRIDSTPSGANVWVDGTPTDQRTWTARMEFPPGRHVIKVSGISGYADTEETIYAIEGQTTSLHITMPPISPPLPPAEGSIKLLSHPSGAAIWLNDEYTGKKTTATITTTPGMHRIALTLDQYVQHTVVLEVQAGATIQRTYTLEPIEKPPEPPPFTPFAQLLEHFLGEVPGWWKPIDDFARWATDTFGIDVTIRLSPEDAAKFGALELKDKILFVGGPMSIKQVGASTVGKTLTQMTAGQIKSVARTDKVLLQQLWDKIPKIERFGLHTQLQKTVLGREASDAIFKITGPALEKAGIQKLMSTVSAIWKPIAFVGGIVALKEAVSWFHKELPEVVGFPLRDMIRDKNWKQAAVLLPAYETLVGIAANFLRSTGFEAYLGFPIWQGYATGYEATLKNWKELIAEGLTEEETGTLGITTVPTGASIFVDDRLFTYPSNTVISKLLPGNHKITLDLEEHVAHEETVLIKEGEQTELKHEFVEIPPEPTPGSGQLQVAVYDHKTGAAIAGTLFINGIAEKYHLHSYALDLDPQVYEIKVEEIGYEPWEDTVAVTKGEVTKVRAEMEKIEVPPEIPPEVPPDIPLEPPLPPEKGTLEVNANVQAEIFIGGVETGKKTPSLIELTQGIYSVSVKAEGYIDRSTTTLIKTGEKSVVFLEMQKEDEPPPTQLLAKVSISSAPTSAKILVNGVWTKKYTPDSVLLKAGDYEIGLAKSGYKAWSTPLRLEEGT